MKRILSVLLTLAAILSLNACTKKDEIRQPVAFYYRNANIASGTDILVPEMREADGNRDDIPRLLREYLKGPTAAGLVHVIPSETVLYSFSLEEGAAEVVLSDEFAQLSGIDLTISCACITKTILGLCPAQTVKIRCLNTALECGEAIVMDESSLLLFETPTVPTETEGV